MDAHEDFDEFVATRWVRLFRLAYLLTGDEVLAEQLLRTALERSFAQWPKVAQTESPEAHVRRLMVQAFVGVDHRRVGPGHPRLRSVGPERPVGSEDGHPIDHLLLWSLVCALPEAERAVVVLRFSENLTEAATAEELGCSVRTLRSLTHNAMRALRRGLGATRTREVVEG